MIEWPAGLPHHTEASAGDMRPSRPQPETEMEGGDVRLRDRPGDRLRTVPWSRRFLPEQYAQWCAFLADTLKHGTQRFLLPVWTGTAEGDGYALRLVQIVGGAGGVSETPTGRGLHMRVSFSLLVFPAEMVPTPTLTVVDTLIIGRADLDPNGTILVDIDGTERSAAAVDGVFLLDASDLAAGTHAIRVRYSGGAYSAPVTRVVASAFAGPFDGFSASLYDLYALVRGLTSWLGPVIRARRFDGAERDFYAITASPWLVGVDGMGIAEWSGIGASYVMAWYGQKGAARNAVQATTAAQPRIVNAGVLDVGPNGRPALVFDGSNDCLRIQDATGFSQSVDQTTVALMADVTNPAVSPWPFCDVFAGTSVRSGISLVSATARVSGRRTGASPLTHIGGSWTSGWRGLIGRIDYLAATADITVDGVTTPAAFLPPGGQSFAGASVDPPTIGAANVIGFMAGQMSAVLLARSALDPSALDAALNQVRP